METNTKFCPNCGRPINEGASFCANCGAKTNEIPATEPAVIAKAKTAIEGKDKKKLIIMAAAAALVLIIAIVSIAALAGGGERKIVGTWNITEVTMYGVEYPAAEEFGTGIYTITFEKNGTVLLNDDGDIEYGTWSFVDGKANIYFDGEAMVAEYDKSQKQLILSSPYDTEFTIECDKQK